MNLRMKTTTALVSLGLMASPAFADMEAAKAESPVLMRPLPVAVTVWVGANERPAFLDQARWLAEAWNAGHEIAEGRHHFDVIAALEDPDSRMVEQLLG